MCWAVFSSLSAHGALWGHAGTRISPSSVPHRGVVSLSVLVIDNNVLVGGSLVTLAPLSSPPPALMCAAADGDAQVRHGQLPGSATLKHS